MEGADTNLKRGEFLHLELGFLVPFLDVVVCIVLVGLSDIYACEKWCYDQNKGDLPENSVSIATKSAVVMLLSTRGRTCSKFSMVTSM